MLGKLLYSSFWKENQMSQQTLIPNAALCILHAVLMPANLLDLSGYNNIE